MRHVLTSMLRYFKHNTLALTSKRLAVFQTQGPALFCAHHREFRQKP